MLGLKDALLTQTGNLPAAATSTLTAALDLQVGRKGENAWVGEFEIDAPALSTGQLPDTHTMTYDVLVSENADMSSPQVLMKAVLTQTGAGGAGAPAATARFRLPLSLPLANDGGAQHYLAIRATNSGATDASAAAFSFAAVF